MSGNFQDALFGMSRFGRDAYKSGQRDRENKDQLRQEIYSFYKRSAENETDICDEIDLSRAKLEDYLHDFCDPSKVPDYFFSFLEQLQLLIKSTHHYSEEDDGELEGLGFDEIIKILSNKWRETAAKILRISFVVREPPLQIPDPNVMYPSKKDDNPFAD